MRRLQCYRICRKYQMEKYMAAMIWFGRRAETARDAMACCEEMGTSIVLDPCDIWRLTTVTGKNFEQLLADTIELQVVDGVILPNLRMDGEKEQCVFLNEQGRCRIHAMRPGLCRVFPLGRIYEEGRIRYFLQMDACQKPGRPAK